MAIRLCRLGLADYQAVRDLQLRLVAARLTGQADDVILVTEHQPVFTLGRRGRRDHLLVSESFLAERGIELIHIERGGDITYHGPGQVVIYLLLDLARLKIKVRELVTAIEQAVIDFLAAQGVVAERRAGAPGVYVGDAKIAALGLKIKNGCSYHGLALNVDMDLSPFAAINPCGYAGLKVIQTKGLDIPLTAHEAGEQLSQQLLQQLDQQHG